MTMFLILFSAGLICLVSAIFLAIYLLKSDRFLDKSKKEVSSPSYPSYDLIEEESRLARIKTKIGAAFQKIKRIFKRSKESSNDLKSDSQKS
ncbi:MAG: hypothetical protein ACTSYB_03025 [Candidatus Helarchaeota archaeon]